MVIPCFNETIRLSPERALELQSAEALIRALSEPFLYRWAFYVGLIGRWLNDRIEGNGWTERDFIEVPLQQCRDVKGSNMSFLIWSLQPLNCCSLGVPSELRLEGSKSLIRVSGSCY